MELWVDKYKPLKAAEIAGQNKAVLEAQGWLEKWNPGKALMISGKSGIGKTVLAEALCKEKGWFLVRLEANESRNKEAIQSLISSSKNTPLFYTGKAILIDEIEGISGRERGAAAGIVSLIKESKYPIFIVTENPYITKFSSLRNYCDIIKMSVVGIPSIGKRLKEICIAERIEADPDAVKALARFAQGDLRSAINDLQTACLGKKSLGMDDLASLGFRERKNQIFNSLTTIFRAGKIKTAFTAMDNTDNDPDEIFWWVESNLLMEAKTPDEIINSLEALSLSNMYRGLVFKQQNWRFKKISMDLLSSVSLYAKSGSGFSMYKPPQRFLQLARTKGRRILRDSLATKLGKKLHCSKKVVKSEYFPYLKSFASSNPKILEQFGIEKDELKVL